MAAAQSGTSLSSRERYKEAWYKREGEEEGGGNTRGQRRLGGATLRDEGFDSGCLCHPVPMMLAADPWRSPLTGVEVGEE